ncbi:MAG TPA: hypothetical protein VKS20_05145 [Candidatus Acidoferrales bacterium]|nr:hypothetical protein [Candidatus Acidoferrales bacterium]
MSRPDSTRPRIWPIRQTLKLITSAIGTCAVAASLLFLCSGCAHRHAHAAAPVTVPPVPPSPVPTPSTTKPQVSIPAPTTPAPKNPVSTTPPPELNPKPENPKRPETSPPVSEPTRPAAPQISPQISPSDQSQLQQRADKLIANAQQNLHRFDGRQLNSTQKDMVDKIRGFLAQAQDAIGTSDWERATRLSEKAYLLSLDLLKTL